MPEKKIQEQLDAQIKAKRVAEVVEVSEAPLLTSDIFARDDRKTARVEVNFKDQSARLVETSDAPKLTREVLKTKGKPVKTVEMFFDDQIWKVEVYDGKRLSLEVEQMKLLMEYEGQEHDRAAMAERDLAIAQLLLSRMMVSPAFSYKGEGDGTPIEARSPIMIESLCNAYNAINHPTKDEIYQVTVLRGVPADAFTLFGETHEWYPVGGQSKKYIDMSADELSATEARNMARREVLVSRMILDPLLCMTAAETEAAEPNPYPVDVLSERFMETLFEAHKVVNVPEAGLKSLQRFSRASNPDSGRSATGVESVGE